MDFRRWVLFVCIAHALTLPSATAIKSSQSAVSLRIHGNHVILDNGILQVNLTKPDGDISGVGYNGVGNLLEHRFAENRRAYWDATWGNLGPGTESSNWHIRGSEFRVILQNEDQVEVSFTTEWNPSAGNRGIPPLNVDKRYVMLRGGSGFYAYAIYEHKNGWPGLNIYETRMVLKLDKQRFHYMAIADNRRRNMPMPDDRVGKRAETLAYKEAVRIVNPINPEFKGEVDDKYQYSMDNQENKVHGWVSFNPSVGIWQITASQEFKTGGPLKQDLTSHTGPVTLAMFVSCHYAGPHLGVQLNDGEYWKKVFGPVFIYLNTNPGQADAGKLWEDAKSQMEKQVQSWPYSFPASGDYPKAGERGSASGTLLVRDRYLNAKDLPANSAYVGLAAVGEVGSWQNEKKGYQFWTRADTSGSFSIKNVIAGTYDLYAWVPGFIGDYKYSQPVTITPGGNLRLDGLVYEPPRDGPTLWEIGFPDRSAAEFYVPDPLPENVNRLYVNHTDKFRQYGLWDRYSDLYPDKDLVYTVGTSNHAKDWFFAHVNRRTGDASTPYRATTWQIRFQLDKVVPNGTYKLRLALASSSDATLHVYINDPEALPPHFSTGHIRSRNNAIARHGIHGTYWLFNVDVQGSWLVRGENVIYLFQANGNAPFTGVMYDYIRLEEPRT